jgi:hypothetical protein
MDYEQIVWKSGSLMLSPGVGPTVPFATIKKIDVGQAPTAGSLLRIPAGEPDILARADQ